MKKNKHVIQFLAKFFLVYFSLLGIYNFYLKNTQETEDIYSCSPVTKMVTNHSEKVAEFLGYDVYTDQNFDELSIMFMVYDKYVVRIVEGCTSVSIIILFLAFIIAFSGSFKTTVLYGIFGVLLIYLTNIFRIYRYCSNPRRPDGMPGAPRPERDWGCPGWLEPRRLRPALRPT